jgi:hypothetical protein
MLIDPPLAGGDPRKKGVDPMKPVHELLEFFDWTKTSGAEARRTKVKRSPACDALEGRQLLNAAWGPPQGFAGWLGSQSTTDARPAHVRPFDLKGGGRLGGPGFGGNMMYLHGGFRGPGGPDFVGHKLTPPSAQLQSDFKTLMTDEKTLQSEIPSSLTAAVRADQDVIRQAFSKLTPSQIKSLNPDAAPGSDPSANMAANLTAAGVSSTQASAIETDIQNLTNALTTTDPTLQSKIAADKAAIAKDGGPTLNDKGMLVMQ